MPKLNFAYALSLMHKVHQGNNTMHNGQWQLFTGRTLSKRSLGIQFLGRHGSRVAHITSTAFNMQVVSWGGGGKSYVTSNGIKRLSLGHLLKMSDMVNIHLRLSEESTGLMNKERLEKMKAGAILINTSSINGFSIFIEK